MHPQQRLHYLMANGGNAGISGYHMDDGWKRWSLSGTVQRDVQYGKYEMLPTFQWPDLPPAIGQEQTPLPRLDLINDRTLLWERNRTWPPANIVFPREELLI